jgi:hypothetical protein
LIQESRHVARTSPAGELILLKKQDRSLWNREQIAEGLKSHRFDSYTLQAAIAAVHAEAESAAVTDWGRLLALQPAGTISTFAICKSCGSNCNARWAKGRPGAHRRKRVEFWCLEREI